MKALVFVTCMLLYAKVYSQVNLSLGLRAYYPFSGNANDVSGNNNNPVFNNASLTANDIGTPNSAYHFDGATTYMKILNSTSLNMANTMSISLKVRPTGYYTGQCYNNMMIMKGDADYIAGNYFFRFSDIATGCSSTPTTTQEQFYGQDVVAQNPIVQLNEWYNVVWTTDGVTAKLYVNCILAASSPATASGFSSGADLYIGKMNNTQFPYWLNGDLDEIRIYDRAINLDEVKTLAGCPVSNFNISNIINAYTPILALDPCKNKITVEDASQYNPGDTVMLIQMKGALIDVTNTAAFGTVSNYKNAGNYEFNYVQAKSGNVIELTNTITRQYDLPDGKVQLIRVPYYNSVNVSATLTCLPWDGNKGGVLVLNARDTINLSANIDVSGKGFKGGAGYNSQLGTLACFKNDYNYPVTDQFSGIKGESICAVPDNIIRGKGNPAAGGGAGVGHNSGGGGGGNGGTGGFGGYQLDNCGSAPFDNRGIGGRNLPYSSVANKIFAGSGGGAGQADNPGNPGPSGGNGGGIAIIISNYLKSNTNKILANGANASTCTESSATDCHDGMGGGGAGGTVLLAANNFIDNISLTQTGGKGGDVASTVTAAGKIGPGGGGAGGVLFINKPSLPAAVTTVSTGGLNGALILAPGNPWGSTPGASGINVFNLNIPVDNVLFKPNIDSVRINAVAVSCTQWNFTGFGYVNTNPVASWHWDFGDGNTANTQNTSHIYSGSGTYTVTLVVTDINGCRDSISRNTASSGFMMDAGPDLSFCGGPVTVQLNAVTSLADAHYSWTPATNLSSTTIANPVATVSSTIRYYLTVTDPVTHCLSKDSVTITINPLPVVETLDNTAICKGDSITLTTTTGLSNYQWLPAASVSNPTVSNPVFSQTATQMLIVSASNGTCIGKDTVTVTVKPLPVLNTIADTIICSTQTITLATTGNATTYSWSPSLYLDNPGSPSPQFHGIEGDEYVVTGTLDGCISKDSLLISIKLPSSLLQPPSKSFCVGESVMLDGYNGNLVDYVWSPADHLSNAMISNPIASPATTTMYSVSITDTHCNFANNFNVLVSVAPSPVVHAFKSNDVNCLVMSANLSATGAQSYSWSPAGTISSVVVANPIVTPDSTTTYYVTGTNAEGCSGKDSITVSKDNGDGLVTLPNTFTPNGDGKNDCFRVLVNGEIKNFDFVIFNRWGEKVFETQDSEKCWDGNYKGKKALLGNYVYYFTAYTRCGRIVKKGNVLLIR